MGKEKWGYDYTYDCTGNVNVMRCALEVAHRPWMGRVLRDRGGSRWKGDLNPTIPAGHWKELEGNCLWRLEVEDRGAQAGANRHEGGDGLGALHHPHIQGLGSGWL